MDLKFIFFCFNLALALNEQKVTKVLTKKNIDLTDPKFATTRVKVTFQDMIKDSRMWVDKSLIIKEIWEVNYKDVFIVTAPRRWGKTMILTMLDFYHQLPINEDGSEADKNTSENYLYFTKGKIIDPYVSPPPVECHSPPLISGEESLNNNHLANHPVIYIIGASLKIDKNYIRHFRRIIWKTYQKHSSLLFFLENKVSTTKNDAEKASILRDLKKFEQYYYWHQILTLDPVILHLGIKTLSELLANTYKRNVIILFDEYDGYVSNTYFGKEHLGVPSLQVRKDFIEFFQAFMLEMFKYNKHLGKGIITGILPTRGTTGLSGLNNVDLKCVFGSDSFFPYYGIFEHEFCDLVSKRGTNQSLVERAVARYDGYRVLNHFDDRMFSTFSTVGFINALLVNNYWTMSDLTECVRELFHHSDFRVDMAKVIKTWRKKESAFSITYQQMTELSLDDFETIYNLSSRELSYESDKHRNLVFSFFVSVGFISVHKSQSSLQYQHNQKEIPEFVDITIPNMEIFSEIKKYYISSLQQHAGLFIEPGQPLANYMTKNSSETLQPLAKSISQFLLKSTKDMPLEKITAKVQCITEMFYHQSKLSTNEKTFETLLMMYFFTYTMDYDALEDYTSPSPKQLLQQQILTDTISGKTTSSATTYGKQIVDIFYHDSGRKSAIPCRKIVLLK